MQEMLEEAPGRAISVERIASDLDLPISTAYDYVRDGVIPGRLRIGRNVRVFADVYEDWLREQRLALAG